MSPAVHVLCCAVLCRAVLPGWGEERGYVMRLPNAGLGGRRQGRGAASAGRVACGGGAARCPPTARPQVVSGEW